MSDLREQLDECFRGRVCLVGLGNVEYGDDGFGVRLAEALERLGVAPMHSQDTWSCRVQVVNAGTTPERFISRLADERFDHVIFLDAVEYSGAPGSVVLLNSDEMVARFPQVSTHKLSLGLLARQVEAGSRTKVWLLGVQPASLRVGEPLTAPVRATLALLVELLRHCAARSSRGNEVATPPRDSSLVNSAATRNAEVVA